MHSRNSTVLTTHVAHVSGILKFDGFQGLRSLHSLIADPQGKAPLAQRSSTRGTPSTKHGYRHDSHACDASVSRAMAGQMTKSRSQPLWRLYCLPFVGMATRMCLEMRQALSQSRRDPSERGVRMRSKSVRGSAAPRSWHKSCFSKPNENDTRTSRTPKE